MVSSRYEQDTMDISYHKLSSKKSRCRGTVSCSENTNSTRDAGICASIVSHNNVADRPSSHHKPRHTRTRNWTQNRGLRGTLLANTSETILAKILMVGNADTSTLDE